MVRFSEWVRVAAAVILVPSMMVEGGFGWGHYGHEMINRLAVEKLPEDAPAFLKSPDAVAKMEFYSSQPDRWRAAAEAEKPKDETLEPEHFLDLEWADQTGGPLPRRRYDFIRTLDGLKPVPDHPEIEFRAEKVGMLPWAIYESWQKLSQEMREYRYTQAHQRDTAPAVEEILVLAGTLGHYVGDGSQPLHVTYRYDGWLGENPKGYGAAKGIHSRFEANFLNDNVKAARDVAPLMTSAPAVIPDVFADTVTYLRKTNSYVGQVYEIDKVHGFDGAGSAEAKTLVDERVAAGATKLRDLIYTAWVDSATPLPAYTPAKPAVVGSTSAAPAPASVTK